MAEEAQIREADLEWLLECLIRYCERFACRGVTTGEGPPAEPLWLSLSSIFLGLAGLQERLFAWGRPAVCLLTRLAESKPNQPPHVALHRYGKVLPTTIVQTPPPNDACGHAINQNEHEAQAILRETALRGISHAVMPVKRSTVESSL